uniref:Coagulation factor X-like n=1 Tax=Cynoglossus semilaevis TaxID=244447 RepID=A0A3P8VKY9_CYNSE
TEFNKKWLLTVTVFSLLLLFMDPPSAGQILHSTRRRRANAFLEEVLPGDLERECYEEKCSQEEALEIFQTRETMLEFWYRYSNLNPCVTNPCLNGGMCTMEREDFLCLCPPQYHGRLCDSVLLKCQYRNGGCVQYCRDLPGGAGVQCDCADGFKLDADGRSCSKAEQFPCGRQMLYALQRGRSLLDNTTLRTEDNSTLSWDAYANLTEMQDEWMTVNTTGNSTALQEKTFRIVGGDLERPGGSPWQVLVHRSDGYGFCGGTLVSDRWVVSAAHCFEDLADYVTIGVDDKRLTLHLQIKIQKVFIHPHFHSFTFDSDIALILLAEPVSKGPTAIPACLPDNHLSKYLLREDTWGVASGWGRTRYLGRSSRFLRKVSLPVVSYRACAASTEQVITDNMFCAGFLDQPKDACSGDSGGPFVVNYRDTWFLTGVISWGEGCAAHGKFGVYTRLGNFLTWVRETMRNTDLNITSS